MRSAVVDHVVEPRTSGALLARRADRLDRDVVEAAVNLLPPVGLPSGAVAVPGDALLEDRDLLEESTAPWRIARVREYVGLGSDQLVGLRRGWRTAMTDHFPRGPSRRAGCRTPREGVRPPHCSRF